VNILPGFGPLFWVSPHHAQPGNCTPRASRKRLYNC
jgi:hypothetical protein